jgi:C4-dicarboxylate-specific signal transduction histidine kinase
VLAAAYAGHHVALQTGLSRLREAAEHRLDMLATGLEADLSRFDSPARAAGDDTRRAGTAGGPAT